MKIGGKVKILRGFVGKHVAVSDGAIVIVTSRNANVLESAIRGGQAISLDTDEVKVEEVKIGEVKIENIDILPDVSPRIGNRKRRTKPAGGV